MSEDRRKRIQTTIRMAAQMVAKGDPDTRLVGKVRDHSAGQGREPRGEPRGVWSGVVHQPGLPVIPLLLDALSAYRLTRLITADVILDGPRAQVIRRAYVGGAPFSVPPEVVDAGGWAAYAMEDRAAPKLATLVTCRFCAGMYVALAVVAARRLFPRAWPPLAEALAFSAGAALLAGLED